MCEGLHQFFSVSVSLFFFYFNFFDQFWITFNFRKEDAKKYSRNVMQSGPLWIYLGRAWRAAVMTREFIAGVWTRRKSCQNIGFYCWQSVPESSSPKPIFGVGVDNCPILWSLLIYDNGGGCTRALDPSRKCHVSWSFLVSKFPIGIIIIPKFYLRSESTSPKPSTCVQFLVPFLCWH